MSFPAPLCLKQNHDTIKLELPARLKSFNFTLECRGPGPVTVEMSLQRALKRPRSQHGILDSLDTSEMGTQKPPMLARWIDAQVEVLFWCTYYLVLNGLKQRRSFLSAVVKADSHEVDESVTEPESDRFLTHVSTLRLLPEEQLGARLGFTKRTAAQCPQLRKASGYSNLLFQPIQAPAEQRLEICKPDPGRPANFLCHLPLASQDHVLPSPSGNAPPSTPTGAQTRSRVSPTPSGVSVVAQSAASHSSHSYSKRNLGRREAFSTQRPTYKKKDLDARRSKNFVPGIVPGTPPFARAIVVSTAGRSFSRSVSRRGVPRLPIPTDRYVIHSTHSTTRSCFYLSVVQSLAEWLMGMIVDLGVGVVSHFGDSTSTPSVSGGFWSIRTTIGSSELDSSDEQGQGDPQFWSRSRSLSTVVTPFVVLTAAYITADLKIWQQNLRKSQGAWEHLLRNLDPDLYDIACIQEPYLNPVKFANASNLGKILYTTFSDVPHNMSVQSELLSV
ncbi:hypothetical protein BDR03DRAFT_988136 [Suillus americanus]|nr:hypothetical protein BDR03DRAFT_988136 [Suillus americanus]